MENATEALKIAFGIMMFVLALTLSISCFSEANEAAKSIISMRDRETEYTYVEAQDKKIVGVETVVPAMYKAYKENYKIVFLDTDGVTPLPLYKEINAEGISTGQKIHIVDMGNENYANAEEAINHLNMILGPIPTVNTDPNYKYRNEFIHTSGLYKYFQDKEFEEKLGEYYQEDKNGTSSSTSNVNKTKKRVITYILQ